MKSININDNYISKNEIRERITQLEALDKQYYKKVNNQYIYMESGDDYEPGAAIEAYIETKDTTYQSGKNYYIYNSSLGIYELFEDYNIGDPIEGEIFEANFITYDTDVDVFEQLDIYDLVVVQDTNDKIYIK